MDGHGIDRLCSKPGQRAIGYRLEPADCRFAGTALILDPIPGMGLLDDAMIVSLVLRRHEDAFKRSSHAHKLHWPLPTFDIDQLLSVVSPLRLDSFYSSMKTLQRLSAPD